MVTLLIAAAVLLSSANLSVVVRECDQKTNDSSSTGKAICACDIEDGYAVPGTVISH